MSDPLSTDNSPPPPPPPPPAETTEATPAVVEAAVEEAGPDLSWLPPGMKPLADGQYDAIVMGTGLKVGLCVCVCVCVCMSMESAGELKCVML